MNLDQFRATRADKKVLKALTEEQALEAKKLEKRAEALKTLAKSSGWKCLEEYLQKSVRLHIDSLKVTNASDTYAVMQLQNQIEVREDMLRLLESFK
jgi:hypothetical protein